MSISEADREKITRMLYSAVLSDVMDGLGLMNQAMRPFVRPLDEELVLFGRARTGLYMPRYGVAPGEDPYETEIALVKLESRLDQRTEILQIAEHYGAKVVDYGPESLMLRVYGDSDKLDAFLALLGPLGLSEVVRSGKILMARGLAET